MFWLKADFSSSSVRSVVFARSVNSASCSWPMVWPVGKLAPVVLHGWIVVHTVLQVDQSISLNADVANWDPCRYAGRLAMPQKDLVIVDATITFVPGMLFLNSVLVYATVFEPHPDNVRMKSKSAGCLQRSSLCQGWTCALSARSTNLAACSPGWPFLPAARCRCQEIGWCPCSNRRSLYRFRSWSEHARRRQELKVLFTGLENIFTR